uniref:Cuticle protein 6 n=1 Tax=Schizaphis graminum TaxID=13262 RepID=A0A2S2PDZ8_SCHGA
MVSSTTVLQVLFLAYVAASGESPSAETVDKRPEPVSVVADDSGDRVTAASTSAAQPKDVSILKQINKVNDDGSYTFGYEASDGSFKVETRDVAGNVKGMFGFVDDAGRLKRVTYSASNSSGFQAAGSESPRPSPDPTAASGPQTIAGRRNKKDDSSGSVGGDDGGVGSGDETEADGVKSVGVKKVLVSKRPVTVAAAPDLMTDSDADDRRWRGGNDLRRQLPRNEDGDAPDVYGVHGRSSIQESGPVSPVVSALMSELMPVRSYGGRPTPSSVELHDNAVSSRRAAQELQEEGNDGQQYGGPATVQYRERQSPVALYQPRASSYPVTAAYQQQRPVAYLAPAPQRGPSLVALRDELMELILQFVQARVSQLVSVAPYPAPAPYPMPYQQPNYYVPGYYQGPRVAGPTAAVQQGQESSPIVTQTLKDGLIRMLLSTSPRYDPDRIGERSTTRLAYRSTTTQQAPVRSVQIVSAGDGDDDDRVTNSRPVTTETPD